MNDQEKIGQVKTGQVSQIWSSGDFCIWCRADGRLYSYYLKEGEQTPEVGTAVSFTYNKAEESPVTSFTIVKWKEGKVTRAVCPGCLVGCEADDTLYTYDYRNAKSQARFYENDLVEFTCEAGKVTEIRLIKRKLGNHIREKLRRLYLWAQGEGSVREGTVCMSYQNGVCLIKCKGRKALYRYYPTPQEVRRFKRSDEVSFRIESGLAIDVRKI